MAGYVRQDTLNNIADGNIINASDFDNEYDAIEAAFSAVSGHTHDGTAAEGAPITKVGPTQDVVVSISSVLPKTDNTIDLGSSLFEFKDLYIDGTANIDSLVADTADINAGTIDGVTIGGASPGAGTFTTVGATTGNITTVNATTVGATTGNITTVNATTVDTTNIEVTSLKAKDGTSAGSIANSTGVVTLASSVLTTADINGGTMDNVTIGGSTPAAGNFTNLDATGTLAVDGSVTLGDSSADAVTINGTVAPGVVISGSSSGNALRITQTGSGNALLVEDSANPDATPVVIDTVGRVIAGYTASFIAVGASYKFNALGSGGDYPAAFGYTAVGSALPAQISFLKSRGADWATRGVVLANDEVSRFEFAADDGTGFISAARISATVDGTPGTNDMPGRLVFSTTADGASTPTERYRINSAGIHFFGNTTTNTNSTMMVVNGEISETTSGTQYKLASQYDIGTNANQIPLNQYLGTMAFQDADAVSVGYVRSNATTGSGYALGAGSTVTQITSRTTGVTINAACGAITLVSAAGTTTPASFTVTNSSVAATDVIILSQKSGTDKQVLLVTAVAAGSFEITAYTTGGTTTEQPVINFAVIKAVAA